MVKERNFWLVLLLSFVTCGIYFYVFIYTTTQDINTLAGEDGATTDPTLALILSLVTCGIYPMYWFYVQGNRMQAAGLRNNLAISESGSTYLLWLLVGSFLCGLGPWIALYLFLKNYNMLVGAYLSRA